jgi:hypothetical protein
VRGGDARSEYPPEEHIGFSVAELLVNDVHARRDSAPEGRLRWGMTIELGHNLKPLFCLPADHIVFLQQTQLSALKILAVFQIGETDLRISDFCLICGRFQRANR